MSPVRTIKLELPEGGPLGVDIRPAADGRCVVASRTADDGGGAAGGAGASSSPPTPPTAATLLEEGDVLVSVNGVELSRMSGGLAAWVDLLRATSSGGRTLVVERGGAPAAPAPAVPVGAAEATPPSKAVPAAADVEAAGGGGGPAAPSFPAPPTAPDPKCDVDPDVKPKWWRRRRVVCAASLVLLLAGGGAAAWAVLRNEDADDAAEDDASSAAGTAPGGGGGEPQGGAAQQQGRPRPPPVVATSPDGGGDGPPGPPSASPPPPASDGGGGGDGPTASYPSGGSYPPGPPSTPPPTQAYYGGGAPTASYPSGGSYPPAPPPSTSPPTPPPSPPPTRADWVEVADILDTGANVMNAGSHSTSDDALSLVDLNSSDGKLRHYARTSASSSWTLRHVLPGEGYSKNGALAMSGDGRRVVAKTGFNDDAAVSTFGYLPSSDGWTRDPDGDLSSSNLPATPWAIALSGSGDSLAIGFVDGARLYRRDRSDAGWDLDDVHHMTRASPDPLKVRNRPAVAISDDGRTVAYGHGEGKVYVYSWPDVVLPEAYASVDEIRALFRNPKTSTLSAPSGCDCYGYGREIAVSGDGRVLAVATTGYPAGKVYAYRLDDGGTWRPAGTAEYREDGGGSLSMAKLALSRDGSVLAVGNPDNDGNYEYTGDAGEVRAYSRGDAGGSASWSQLGSEIRGRDGDLAVGKWVSLSSDGTVLVVEGSRRIRTYEIRN